MKSAAGSRDAAVLLQQKTVFVQRNMDRRNRHCRHFSPGRRDNGNWYNGNGNGDKEGLRQFYEETARSVYSFIFSVLKDPHESEDVMQETFLAVWEHAGDYVPYGKPLAWVFTIARRLCYMRLREKKRQETLEDGEIDDTGVPQPQLEQTAERTALLQALDQLNETERQIVLLYAAAGMKHREIAQVLNMPQATELSKYSRSVKKLQKMLYAS